MREIQEILKKIELLKPDEKAVLATVVDVQGSSYRLPGAKMLILENGETFGTVSGGCLEADVLERAKKVLETGEPQVFVYDTTDDLDSVFSLNMGCRGVIRILLERFDESTLVNFLKFCQRENKDGVIGIIIKSDTRKIGLNFFARNIDEIEFNVENHERDFSGISNAFRYAFISKKSKVEKFGNTEIFIDYIAQSTNLTIFGAGADAVPLTKIAKNLGWRVTVVDHREAYANDQRFAEADKIIISRPEEIGEKLHSNESSVYVLMTHNYEHDKNILRHLLKTDAKYIGALGPKRRAENILQEFAEEGLNFSDEELNKLYSPVGLDIGADTPEAIALAIIAEINAVLKERNGGFLRERKGSIYGRE